MTSADEVRFTAPDGTHWSVHEVASSPARPWAGRSLIFVSEHGFRRVYNFPRNWRELQDDELLALSWQR